MSAAEAAVFALRQEEEGRGGGGKRKGEEVVVVRKGKEGNAEVTVRAYLEQINLWGVQNCTNPHS